LNLKWQEGSKMTGPKDHEEKKENGQSHASGEKKKQESKEEVSTPKKTEASETPATTENHNAE
jgi:hypothetical protein